MRLNSCIVKLNYLAEKTGKVSGLHTQEYRNTQTHTHIQGHNSKALVFRKQSPITPVLSLTLHNKRKEQRHEHLTSLFYSPWSALTHNRVGIFKHGTIQIKKMSDPMAPNKAVSGDNYCLTTIWVTHVGQQQVQIQFSRSDRHG